MTKEREQEIIILVLLFVLLIITIGGFIQNLNIIKHEAELQKVSRYWQYDMTQLKEEAWK